MYSSRSNASARKPFDFLQPPMVPKFGSPEDNSMGFGTLPSPKPIPAGINDQAFGLPIGTNGIYGERQYASSDELRNQPPLLEPPARPAGMHSAWQEGPDPSSMPGRGRGAVPEGYDKEAWYEQGLLVPIEETQRKIQELLRQKQARQQDPLADLSRKTAAMQGVPMGANNGSIVNFDDFQLPQDPSMMYQPQQFQQPQYQPMMGGNPMPYQGGMSGPHFQGQMQSMLGDLLGRQQMGRQFNDVTFARDAHDDAWDSFRSDIFNPLMGALGGGRTMAAMQQDSNSRRALMQNRRQFRRQTLDDQWGQTKDLVGMIAANDPQALKNQFALQKLQYEYMQKQINQQNANTQQFGAQTNAAYKSRMASVAEDNSRRSWQNLQRLAEEGADRSAQGWKRIAMEQARFEQSLELRQAELEQRKAEAAQRGDQFAVQLAFKQEQELNDEAYRYQKLKDDLVYKAEQIDKEGNSKVSPEFLKKYGLQHPTSTAPNQNQANWLNWFGSMLGSTPPPTTTNVSTKTPPSSASVARSPQFTREQALAELARRRKARAGQ